MLSVPFSALVALPSLLFEDDDFLVFFVFEDLGSHGSSLHGRTSESGFAVVNDHENLVDLDLIAFICIWETVHEQFVALFNGELTSLGLYSGFHDEENRLKNHFRGALASVILAFALFVFLLP